MIDAVGEAQSILVLGGASEIGGAIVEELVRRRCRTVVLAGRPGSRLEDAAHRFREAGATDVRTSAFDATDVHAHAQFARTAFEDAGGFDVVLVAAGVIGDQTADEHDPAAAATVITTNFTGLAAAMLAITDQLRLQGHGRLVVLSSVAAERARRANFIYGSSKAGLDAFSQGLGDSVARTGVGVLLVRPGFVVTRMTAGMRPAPFSTTPEAVAAAVVGAMAAGKEVVYAPGILRWVFFVMRHLPRVLWRRMPV